MTSVVGSKEETRAIAEFAEQAYLNYAMYVIMDRALPQVSDGLKPVQRRIIYAMSELGLRSTAKPKKSARTVGDVLGKFHPHGDSACYEAMVLMAQPFSYRYPLIEGQGNWGSSDDPKSYAAMRYTEAKMSAYSDIFLRELDQQTVEWQDNFDGSVKEPVMLPARLPNILLNGTTGIAVGMATDIPPHNLTEVVSGTIALINNPLLGDQELSALIPGPDLPTDAEIISSPQDLLALQVTGRGSFRTRAVYTTDKHLIVVHALPYQVSGAKVLGQIADQMQAKKLPLVVDLRDESDHEHPTRLVIELRSPRVEAAAVMSHLFATTDLEVSHRVNLNVIGLDGRPQVKSIREILLEWIDFRKKTVRLRLEFNLRKIEKRLHILAGLLVAYLNIDEVIAIIREFDNPKAELMTRFMLDEIQADAILDLKLRHLAKLEEVEIRREQEELSAEQAIIAEQLANPGSLKKLIVGELKADAKTFGDVRRSPIVARSIAVEIKESDMLPAENITIVVSQAGWVRAAKGWDVDPSTLNYKAGDGYLSHALGKSNQRVFFLDDSGRSYALDISSLPSARGQGEPLVSRLTLPASAKIVQVLSYQIDQFVLLASNKGYGFICPSNALDSSMKAGKAIVSLADSAALMPAAVLHAGADRVGLLSTSGRLLIYSLADLPQLNKGKGNKLMALDSSEALQAMVVFGPLDQFVVRLNGRELTFKSADVDHYTGKRGQRGHLLPRGYVKANELLIRRKDGEAS